LLVHIQPGLVRQPQVEQNNIGRLRANSRKPFGAGAGHLNPVTGRGKRLAHLLWDQGWVIIDE